MSRHTNQEPEGPERQPCALTLTVVSLFRERHFSQPVELILTRHSETYSTLGGQIAIRLREVVDDIAEFHEQLKVPPSVCPVTPFYFEHGYRAAGELKGDLDEDQKYYKDAIKCLAIRGKKIAGLRFATKQGDRLYCVWHNEIMRIGTGFIVSRSNKICLASATKVVPARVAGRMLRKPMQALRKGINDIKALPSDVKQLKLGLDDLLH